METPSDTLEHVFARIKMRIRGWTSVFLAQKNQGHPDLSDIVLLAKTKRTCFVYCWPSSFELIRLVLNSGQRPEDRAQSASVKLIESISTRPAQPPTVRHVANIYY